MNKKKLSPAVLFSIAGVGLVIAFLVAVGMGSVDISVREVVGNLFLGEQTRNYGILVDIRLPRVCTAILIGACLSVSGVLLQAVMRNPLADPGITGISSGASVTTMLMMLYLPQFTGLIPVAGFIGGSITCILV